MSLKDGLNSMWPCAKLQRYGSISESSVPIPVIMNRRGKESLMTSILQKIVCAHLSVLTLTILVPVETYACLVVAALGVAHRPRHHGKVSIRRMQALCD